MAWLTPFNDLLTGKDLKYAALQHALLSDQAWIRRVLDICANTAIVSSFSPNGGAPCTSHTASQTSIHPAAFIASRTVTTAEDIKPPSAMMNKRMICLHRTASVCCSKYSVLAILMEANKNRVMQQSKRLLSASSAGQQDCADVMSAS